MQDMRSFFGRGIWDTIFLALFDSWRMELPKELKGELLTNDFALVNVDDSYGRRYLGEAHLRRNLKRYAAYYNELRTHRSLGKDAPISRAIQHVGCIASKPVVGGLHHHYCRI